MEANRLENVSAWYFFNWLRCWSRFGRVDKPLKRMINRERKREKGDRYIWRKKNLIMSPHGKGHDRYQFIFRLKRDSLPQLHDATSATRDPFPPFRMALELDFLKTYPIVWPRLAKSDSCLAFLFTVIQIIPSLDALVRLAIKDVLNFSGSIVRFFHVQLSTFVVFVGFCCKFKFVKFIHPIFQITLISIQISIKFKFVANFTLDRCEHLFTRNTSYKINKVYDVILFDKVHASTR